MLGFNKNTVQRTFQLWEDASFRGGIRPPIQSLPLMAVPNKRWANYICRIWAGRNCWATMALVSDCNSHELLGWHLPRSRKSKTPESALEQALIIRFGTLGRLPEPFLLRPDYGLAFTGRSFTVQHKKHGLLQEFIMPHSPEQSGRVERVIRTLTEQGVCLGTALIPCSAPTASSATGSTSTTTGARIQRGT